MHEIHPQKACCRQQRVMWLSGVLTSVTSPSVVHYAFRRVVYNLALVSPLTSPFYPAWRYGMSSPTSIFQNPRYLAMESQSRSKWLEIRSCRRSLFDGECCKGSSSFGACFHQQQANCHIDVQDVNDAAAPANEEKAAAARLGVDGAAAAAGRFHGVHTIVADCQCHLSCICAIKRQPQFTV